MPTIQKKTLVLANTTSQNILADELHRFIQAGRPVRVQCKASATGIKTTVLQQSPIVNSQDINFNATNQFPDIQTDMLTSFRSQGGELFVTHQNTTGANIDVVTKIEIA